MPSRTISGRGALGLALIMGCSVDGRNPEVATEPVMPACDPERDAPRCAGDFVERCAAAGAWQLDEVVCALGCDDGACAGAVEPEPPSDCGNDGDACDDGLFCTTDDACESGQCRGQPRVCDDGVACTVGDACDEERNQCTLGAPSCPGVQVCDAESGECSASCAGCRVDGICHADGAASPVNPCEICDAAANANAFSFAASSVRCDDAAACTENDRCSAGSCAGTPLACAEGQRCIESAGMCQPIVPGCSSAGQRVCFGGDVHECDVSLVTSRLVTDCDGGCDSGADPVACVGRFTLVLDVASVQVVQGASASVSFTLLRDDDHALPVELTLQGLPPGADAPVLELGGGEDFGTLTLSAGARTAEGVRTALTVRASDGFNDVTQPLELFVRGEPGSLDLSFGASGVARAEPPGAPGFQGTRVVVDAADRILVAATSRFVLDPLGVPARASLTRLSSRGTLDGGFGDGGTYLETPGSGSLGEGPTTFLGGVALAPDGYVLAGPLGEGNPQEASFVTRLDDDGERAAGFSAPTLGGGLHLTDVAVENGTIFATGDSLGNPALYISALNGNGAQRFVDFSLLSSMQAVFWSPADNDFVMGGNCDPNACFARFLPERQPPALSLSRITTLTPASASILDGTADAQGRYFAIGSGWNLIRFLPEAVRPPGSPSLVHAVDALSTSGRQPQGIELFGDRLYVAAVLANPSAETGIPAIVRYSTTWARDAGFGSGGVAQLDGVVEVGSSVDVAVQSDGRVIVATVDGGELVVYRVWD